MKIFGKHTYDKELASKIHNRFLKFNHREKKNNPIEKWERTEQTPQQEDMQMTNMHRKRCSAANFKLNNNEVPLHTYQNG